VAPVAAGVNGGKQFANSTDFSATRKKKKTVERREPAPDIHKLVQLVHDLLGMGPW
jgi:hypothetical protein